MMKSQGNLSLIMFLVVMALTPWDCKDQCKACVCRFDNGAWTCECVIPREG